MDGKLDFNGNHKSRVHIMNVGNGDCHLIEHMSGRTTVIDICCGNTPQEISEVLLENRRGNFRQKEHPINPIDYMKNIGVDSVFRFILTHPDMDHMDGIESLFKKFRVMNFWDTENDKVCENVSESHGYQKSDWEFYKKIRNSVEMPKVLRLCDDAHGEYYNKPESESDDIYILSPSKDTEHDANKSENYNDLSYVLLYRPLGWKIVFPGDSEKMAWDDILAGHRNEIENVDILIAPHHGRESGGNENYLNVLKPRFIVVGNAPSRNIGYNAFKRFEHITKNQAGNIVFDINMDHIDIFVSNASFLDGNSECKTIGNTKYYLYERLERF